MSLTILKDNTSRGSLRTASGLPGEPGDKATVSTYLSTLKICRVELFTELFYNRVGRLYVGMAQTHNIC